MPATLVLPTKGFAAGSPRTASPGGDDHPPAWTANDDTGDDGGSHKNDDDHGSDLALPAGTALPSGAPVVGAGSDDLGPGPESRQTASAPIAELCGGSILVLA